MKEKYLFNDGWEFQLTQVGATQPEAHKKWEKVEIPHDWLIWNVDDLYKDGDGWYHKHFAYNPTEGEEICYLRFDGVYMDSTIWINGEEVFSWKYGYSTFTIDCTAYLKNGDNEILVRVRHQAPNSRWYSGAGIYRNVWMLCCPLCHIVPDGVYITPRKVKTDRWEVLIDTEVEGNVPSCQIYHRIVNTEGQEVAFQIGGFHQEIRVENPQLWDLDTPITYRLITTLYIDGIPVQTVENSFGFRTIELKPESGLWLNGKRRKLNGVCQHHDLGCLGAAFNKDALRRQFAILQEMGVNAIRTSHNMPAPELMELADEMGLLICSEAFDMWKRSKTPYDYARFFGEWFNKDVKSWVRRDRNHPSLIFWSIGNEIYDTHADVEAVELTKALVSQVRLHDPWEHAFVTIGSNYMSGENARRCAEYVQAVGYNYGERMYEQQHMEHPEWVIYGSETCSVVQSRGIYHFPVGQSLLADDDEQCSSLGNSATSWGAKSTEICILNDYRAEFSAGQFIWTGTDYIGEPTPYHTRNSYFGQIDTAGFPKDSFYIFQAAWKDYRTAPMIHIFPYWDFSEGQQIDVRVCSNAPEVELFFNGVSQGRQELGLDKGKLIADFSMHYHIGNLTAIAYNKEGMEIARDVRESFGEPVALRLTTDKEQLSADGKSLAFLTITAVDREGRTVENAVNRILVKVEGAARLMGVDNGDSTDPEAYKTCSRRLFSGKLLAVVGSVYESGDIMVSAISPGLQPMKIKMKAQKAVVPEGASNTLQRADLPVDGDLQEIPVRKIELSVQEDCLCLTPEHNQIEITAHVLPENASYDDLEWAASTASGIESPIASLTAMGKKAVVTAAGDGDVWIRCISRNGRAKPCLISQLRLTAQGHGKRCLNPYGFISGGLYTDSNTELNNGNERGVATPPTGESQIRFANVDFGEYGSDVVTLPLFSLTKDPFPVEIWEGVPGEKGAEHICTVTYNRGSVFNSYLKQTFLLPKRLQGIKDITFIFRQKVHMKGFYFKERQKAYEKLAASQCDALYGDSFRRAGNCIEEIGNNVTVSFHRMVFTEAPSKLIVSGRTDLKSNTIHLHLKRDGQEDLVLILEFGQAAEYTIRNFDLPLIETGVYDAELVFLPGSRFDLEWIQFEK